MNKKEIKELEKATAKLSFVVGGMLLALSNVAFLLMGVIGQKLFGSDLMILSAIVLIVYYIFLIGYKSRGKKDE